MCSLGSRFSNEHDAENAHSSPHRSRWGVERTTKGPSLSQVGLFGTCQSPAK